MNPDETVGLAGRTTRELHAPALGTGPAPAVVAEQAPAQNFEHQFKIALVVRREGDQLRRYGGVGVAGGNWEFDERVAKEAVAAIQ